jgi:hypothetical protein
MCLLLTGIERLGIKKTIVCIYKHYVARAVGVARLTTAPVQRLPVFPPTVHTYLM